MTKKPLAKPPREAKQTGLIVGGDQIHGLIVGPQRSAGGGCWQLGGGGSELWERVARGRGHSALRTEKGYRGVGGGKSPRFWDARLAERGGENRHSRCIHDSWTSRGPNNQAIIRPFGWDYGLFSSRI